LLSKFDLVKNSFGNSRLSTIWRKTVANNNRNMMKSKSAAVIVAVTAVLMAETAYAVEWVEVGDAPEGVPARQDTVGVGPLERIIGAVDSALGDYTDTYSIIITDPSAFYATTKVDLGGAAVLSTGEVGDAKLWLWDVDGNVLLANDDITNASIFPAGDFSAPYLSDPSTFQS
jgi:hypothetical protein